MLWFSIKTVECTDKEQHNKLTLLSVNSQKGCLNIIVPNHCFHYHILATQQPVTNPTEVTTEILPGMQKWFSSLCACSNDNCKHVRT